MTDETMKAYRLHVWRDHLARPCSVCGSTTYRSLNTQQNGLRVCGQCGARCLPTLVDGRFLCDTCHEEQQAEASGAESEARGDESTPAPGSATAR